MNYADVKLGTWYPEACIKLLKECMNWTYKYYLSLFKKIKKAMPATILEHRIRIPNCGKVFIVAKAGVRSKFNIL